MVEIIPDPQEWKTDEDRIVWIDRHALVIRSIAYMNTTDGCWKERADFIVRSAHSHKALCEALERVGEALKCGEFPSEYVNEGTWNPQAHVPVTLTIEDCRKVFAALRAAG